MILFVIPYQNNYYHILFCSIGDEFPMFTKSITFIPPAITIYFDTIRVTVSYIINSNIQLSTNEIVGRYTVYTVYALC